MNRLFPQTPRLVEKVGECCPKCKGELLYRTGMYGRFIGCSSFPNCKYSRGLVHEPEFVMQLMASLTERLEQGAFLAHTAQAKWENDDHLLVSVTCIDGYGHDLSIPAETLASKNPNWGASTLAWAFKHQCESVCWKDKLVAPPDKAAKQHVSVENDLAKVFPGLFANANCPVKDLGNCSLKMTSVSDVIQHLNDEHRWPREDIAAWIESLEIDFTLHSSDEGD